MSQGGEVGEGGGAQGQEAMKVVTKRRKPSGATWAFMCLSLPLALEAPPIHHSTPPQVHHHFLFFFSFASLASSASCWSLLNFIFFLPRGVLKYHSWGGRGAGMSPLDANPPFPWQAIFFHHPPGLGGGVRRCPITAGASPSFQ